MHCPKCGDLLASDAARFCRRCGFEIEGVREFLAAESPEKKFEIDSVREFLTAAVQEKKLASQRATRKHVRWAVAVSMAAIMAMFINFTLRYAFSVPAIFGKSIVITLLLCAFLFFLVFSVRKKHRKSVKSALPKAKTTKELRPPQEYVFDSRALTQREIAPPPSVTEGTTKFFEDQSE